jgi:defect-in-organelle-trafficking protein DotC
MIKKTLSAVMALAAVLAVASAAPAADAPPEGLGKYWDATGSGKAPTVDMGSLRDKALAEVAERIGTQVGVRERFSSIRRMLDDRAAKLDGQFDFAPLLLNQGAVMPPVIAKVENFAEVSRPDEMVRVETSYKILVPAHFVSIPPSWRDYLLVPEAALAVEDPQPGALPSGAAERQLWRDGLSRGYRGGCEQADAMFRRSLSRLETDMLGAAEFIKLERSGYVSIPMVSKGQYAIKVGDRQMEVNQEVFRIVKDASFKDAQDSKAAKGSAPSAPKARKGRARASVKKAPAPVAAGGE